MGGYAAILFGCLLDADQVLAFSARTLVDGQRRDICVSDRGFELVQAVSRLRRAQRQYFDLRPIIEQSKARGVNLYYASDLRADKWHAERLEGLPNVTLHRFEMGGHSMIRTLRDRGDPAEMLASAVEGPVP